MKSTEPLRIPSWRREVRPKEAAQLMGCSVGFIYQLMKEGRLESRKLTRRGYDRGIRLISVDSIERVLAEPAQEATPAQPVSP